MQKPKIILIFYTFIYIQNEHPELRYIYRTVYTNLKQRKSLNKPFVYQPYISLSWNNVQNMKVKIRFTNCKKNLVLYSIAYTNV